MSEQDPLAEAKKLAQEISDRNRLTPDDDPRKVLSRHLDWLVGEVSRLRELLGRLEWAGSTQAYQQAFCPVCQRSKLGGHGRACWLAAELRP